ncbi:MAG: DUF1553 domain-containing protein [Spirochaetes bacterium]|nr:DUF1553 domain-containing protein [Spirochaetota bacterium]
MTTGKILIAAALLASAAWPQREPIAPFELPQTAPRVSPIDDLVFDKLAASGKKPNYLVSDEVYARRVAFDLTGTLPTAAEMRAFLADRSTNKRARLVDRLLASDPYASYFTMKWCDLLRVKSEFPINLWPNAVQAYQRFIYASIKTNLPFDRFSRALLTTSGGNFLDPAANFYRAVQKKEPYNIAQAVALTFMGARFEAWPAAKQAGLAAFFSKVAYKSTLEWKEEIVFFDPDLPAFTNERGQPIDAVFPDGARAALDPAVDPRKTFADWLLRPENPYFGKAIANRVWYWMMGRGIVHEPDDFRDGNPPQNAALLAWLEGALASNGYDLKALMRLIAASGTYQQSSIPLAVSWSNDLNFSRYLPRRLEAEVLIDAICQLTGTSESYSSPIPEPFTFIPPSSRSVDLADGSINSAFTEMFGRPARDTGTEAERNNTPNAEQKIHLLNSSHILDKFKQARNFRRAIAQAKDPEKSVDEVYLWVLSRAPTEAERQAALAYSKVNRAEPWIDLAWSLVNANEFQFKH